MRKVYSPRRGRRHIVIDGAQAEEQTAPEGISYSRC
jgi:hypothetical protein